MVSRQGQKAGVEGSSLLFGRGLQVVNITVGGGGV